MSKCDAVWYSINIIVFLGNVNAIMGQEEAVCYGAGSIAASVILTLIVGAIVVAVVYYFWRKYWDARKGKHLILEADPEKGKGEYAFDNPGFKDAGFTPANKSLDKGKVESGNKNNKWNQWSPLGALSTRNERKRTQDDLAVEEQIKVVSLRSHDFTGLGFNIYGNMKEGIFIKDILNRGPAYESGKLNAGDRITCIAISFEHMVYEDALTILSYASPYDVTISAKNGKNITYTGQAGSPGHPVYKSSSSVDLTEIGKVAKKRLFQPDEISEMGSNCSSLQKPRSTATTLERKGDQMIKTSHQLKTMTQLEEKIIDGQKENMRTKSELQKVELETQKTENRHQKFGIKVFPNVENIEPKSPKLAELSQNENNLNLELTKNVMPIEGIDEVDKKVAPPVKKREKINKPAEALESVQEPFQRQSSLNSSGIKRDNNNIPLEIPHNMYNAALAARKNRKSCEEDELKSPKKSKGKAPAPPELKLEEEENTKTVEIPSMKLENSENVSNADDSIEKVSNFKDYNSDSDIETDNQSSVNTIELNPSDITIHQSEENEEKQNRKTASTGDLTKIQKTRKTSSGTLERAQSLDITDTTIPTLTKKRKIEDNDSKTSSDESLYGNVLINKEPRLSLILDGLNTFQRSRLKKSTEWGNLEDAILNVDKLDGSSESLDRQSSSYEDFKLSSENLGKTFQFGVKSPEFDALVNKINEIKQETIEIINEQDRNVNKIETEVSSDEMTEIIDVPKSMETMSKTIEDMPKSIEFVASEGIKLPAVKVKNEIWPFPNSDENKSDVENKQIVNIFTINDAKRSLKEQGDKPYEMNRNRDVEETRFEKDEGNQVDNVSYVEREGGAKRFNIQAGPFEINDDNPRKIEEDNFAISKTSKEFQSGVEVKPPKDSSQMDISSVKVGVKEINTNSSDFEQNNTKIYSERKGADQNVGQMNTTTTNITSVCKPADTFEVNFEKTYSERKDIDTNLGQMNTTTNITSVCKPADTFEVNFEKTQTEDVRKEISHKPTITDKITKDMPVILKDVNNFIEAERESASKEYIGRSITINETNESDDIKVSKHSGTVEAPKYTQTASIDNISNIAVLDPVKSNYEISINKTAIANHENGNRIIENVTSPDLIKNITIAEALHEVNNEVTVEGPTSLTLEISGTGKMLEEKGNEFRNLGLENLATNGDINKLEVLAEGDKSNSSLTYITEIQVVTPNSNTNVSEIEIIPSKILENPVSKDLDQDFEKYIQTFESNIKNFEHNINNFEQNIQEVTQTAKKETSVITSKSIVISEKVDPERELLKVQEIVEEQLKKLPEMRFTTSSYESQIKPPEKRQSQIEILRSNFEKSPPRTTRSEISPPKSRIPILNKTPPTSPERRDSKNLETEPDKAILEMMSSQIPMSSSLKYQQKPTNRNVTVTSIRNSKIPSGLPTYSSRPPVPPRRTESEDNVIQVSTNGSSDSFKQWVFNPTESTVITLTDTKFDHHK